MIDNNLDGDLVRSSWSLANVGDCVSSKFTIMGQGLRSLSPCVSALSFSELQGYESKLALFSSLWAVRLYSMFSSADGEVPKPMGEVPTPAGDVPTPSGRLS